MVQSQRETKAWIKAVADHMGLSPSALADGSGIAPSTVTRYLNDASGEIGISQRSLDAIAVFSGVAVHKTPPNAAGFAEPEPVPFKYEEEKDAPFVRAVRALTEGRAGRDPWVIKGYGLDLLGYMPGDVVVVDLNARPRDGDVVCAQVYDWSGRGGTETVFRVLNDPYLLTASSRITVPTPLVVDNKRVLVKGVVGPLLRPSRKPG